MKKSGGGVVSFVVRLMILHKRFLKNRAFIVLLAMVPLMVLAMRLVSSKGEGALVADLVLQQEDSGEECAVSERIVDDLCDLHGIVGYRVVSDENEARRDVEEGDAACAVFFPGDLEESLANYKGSDRVAKIGFLTKEDTPTVRLVREQIYGVMYRYIAPAMVQAYIRDNDTFSGLEDEARDAFLENDYERWTTEGNLFELRYSDFQVIDTDQSYLTAPLRGIFANFLLLCGFAASLFFIRDKRNGAFLWVRPGFLHAAEFIYILTAVLDASVAVLIALVISGYFTTPLYEIGTMLLLDMSISGFVTLLRRLLRRESMVGTAAVLITMLSLVLCPVFISINRLGPLQHLMPPYFYLTSLHSPRMTIELALYAAAATALSTRQWGRVPLSNFLREIL